MIVIDTHITERKIKQQNLYTIYSALYTSLTLRDFNLMNYYVTPKHSGRSRPRAASTPVSAHIAQRERERPEDISVTIRNHSRNLLLDSYLCTILIQCVHSRKITRVNLGHVCS